MDLFAWHVIGSLLQSTKISLNIQAPPMSSSISLSQVQAQLNFILKPQIRQMQRNNYLVPLVYMII
jgi:hypothetical protein